MIAFCNCCHVCPCSAYLPATIAVNCTALRYLLQQNLSLNAIFISIFYIRKTPSSISQTQPDKNRKAKHMYVLSSIIIITQRFSDFGFETFRKKIFFCLSFPLNKTHEEIRSKKACTFTFVLLQTLPHKYHLFEQSQTNDTWAEKRRKHKILVTAPCTCIECSSKCSKHLQTYALCHL